MSKSFLDKVYEVQGDAAKRALYDDWAGGYDDDVMGAGYATPRRIAEALARHLPDRAAPVLDFGCGTGLSGAALAQQGFRQIDGCDPSTGMLDEARAKGVYDTLWTITEGAPLDPPRAYRAIAACGVISRGAAPPETFDVITPLVPPGGLIVVSYNSHTFEDPDYMGKIDAVLGSGFSRLEAEEGPHLPDKGLTSRVFVLRRDG